MMYAVLIDILQDFLCGWLDNTKIQRSMLHEAYCSERPKKSARRCSTQYWTLALTLNFEQAGRDKFLDVW